MNHSPATWRLGIAVVLTVAAIIAAASATVAISRTPQSANTERSLERQPTIDVGPTSVTIFQGDTAAVIGRRLLSGNAIDSDTRFELLALLMGWEGRLEPGDYSFEPGLTTFEILRRIHFGETSPLSIVIPEGLRVEQVTERLVAAGIVEREAFVAALEAAADDVVAESLAAQRPSGVSLEGYLFPSAYAFPLEVNAEKVLREMLVRFSDVLTPQVWEQINASGRSFHEILTIASIIEREVIEDSERALVSAVIWNRLQIDMRLQMDPTVQYAVGRSGDWWKVELTGDDLAYESAYNTYVIDGLPPTPIASPGLASIEAAANPASVPYLYFVARGDGTHAFAVTYEEHQANIERYREGSQ